MIKGECSTEFLPVARALERQLARTRYGGAAVCVYHRGKKVVDIWGGVKDMTGRPWQSDTMSVSFSTTKGVTATALHLLVDRGLLDYDDRVAKFWPEFAQAGKGDITVRHLLSHQAGLYPMRSRIDHARRMLDWEYMIDTLAKATPAHRPGTAHGYHAFTFGWLVGEVVQRVTGRRLAEVIESELARPLGLDGLYIGAPAEQIPRAAELFMSRRGMDRVGSLIRNGERIQRVFSALRLPVNLLHSTEALAPEGIEHFEWSAPETLAASIPAANGLFTARSLARLYAVLGGAANGTTLLSEDTLRRATEVQSRKIDLVVPFPMHWRLGYHRAATMRGTPPRAFGHYGFGGSGAWVDPDRRLAMAMVLNSGLGTPFGDLRTARIGGTVLACADRIGKPPAGRASQAA
jgi:CubicO group peptidase (beta-lactamase class C family)